MCVGRGTLSEGEKEKKRVKRDGVRRGEDEREIYIPKRNTHIRREKEREREYVRISGVRRRA